MRKLYSFTWDCGRQGGVEGLFIEEESKVKGFIGWDVQFGEILGKHSDVHGTLDEGDLKVISEDQEKIDWLESIVGLNVSGYNPLDYVRVDCDLCSDPIFECGKWNDYKEIDGEKVCSYCVELENITNKD